MGSYAALQLFSPPGITGVVGTPNLLRDLSNAMYQAQWGDVTQGGVSSAQFDCHKEYGDTVDVLFKAFVLWGFYGAQLSAGASSGAGHVTVTGLLNEKFPAGESFADLIAGDIVMLTDGVNTELFSVASVSGSGPWTVSLNAPGNSLLGLGGVLLNSYSAGAILVRLQFQGYLSQRVHATTFDNQFSVNATGFFNRYNQVLQSYSSLNVDGGTWMYTNLRSIAGGAQLALDAPSETTVWHSSDLASLLVGEKVSIGIEEGNAEGPFTITAITVANGTFTATPASGKLHHAGEVVSPAGVADGLGMHDLVISKGLMAFPNGTKINLQTSSQPLAQTIAAVVRQETGSAKTSTWACWADVLRQVHHQSIPSAPPNMGQTKMSSDAPAGSTTFHVANIGRVKVGRRVFITGAAGFDSLKVSAVHSAFNSFDTVGPSSFDHPAGDKVVIIYDVTPNFTISLEDNGSGYGDTIGKIQTTDEDGTQLINAAIVTGTVMSQNGQIQSQLTAPVQGQLDSPPGSTAFSVIDDLFSNDDTVTLVAKGGVNTENVVITGNPTGAGPYTYPCTQIQHNHAAGQAVVLASGSGAGPTIIVFESDSIGEYDYFEGQITSQDITDKVALAAWAKQQIEITAWPAINAAIDLDLASCRIDGRTLLGIVGFVDGVPVYLNATQVQYQFLAATRSVTGSIQAGCLKSTFKFEESERAKAHSIRDKYRDPRKQPNGMQGHIAGGGIYPNADNTFAMDATTVKYGGAIFQVAAVSGKSAPEGVSLWGIDVSNPAAPALSLLPSVVFNGRSVYAEAIYQATDDDGVGLTLVSQFTGIPLWRVEVRAGAIVGVWPLFATNGVDLGNLPSATAAPPAPTFSSAVPSAAAIGNGLGADLSLSVAFSNIPQDGATHSIKYYVRTNGTTSWSHKFTRKIPGLPFPSATSYSDNLVFQNMASSGSSVDIAASYEGLNGESTLTVLVTGYTIPGQAASSATETQQAVVTVATRLLATNANRQGVVIYNAGNSTMFVGTDNSTSTVHFMDEIGPKQRWTMPIAYTGELWAIWAAPDTNAGAQANIAAFPS